MDGTLQLLSLCVCVCVWNAANCYGQANVKRATRAGNCVFPVDCKLSWKLNTNFWYMALALCCSRHCCLLTGCNISNNISTFQHSPSSADKILLRLPQDPAFPALPPPPPRRFPLQRHLFICICARSSITFNAFDVLQHGQYPHTRTHALPLAHTHTHSDTGRGSSWVADCGGQRAGLPLSHSHILFSQTFLEIVEIFQPCFVFLLHLPMALSLRQEFGSNFKITNKVHVVLISYKVYIHQIT